MYVYMYIVYIYMYVCTCIHIYKNNIYHKTHMIKQLNKPWKTQIGSVGPAQYWSEKKCCVFAF